MKKKAALIAFFVAGCLLLPAPAPVQALVDTGSTEMMISKGLAEGLRKKIFLDLRDINVVDVLKFLALEGDINIVTSKNVQGRSTLLLRNVSIGDGLEIIIVSNNLAYDIKGEIIYVMTEDEYFALYGKNFNDKKVLKTRTLRYAKPSYVLTALQSIQSSIGKIIIDEETGQVIMIDTEEKVTEMNALLNEVEAGQETRVVLLKYASAKDVEAQLRSRLDAKSVGNIFGDARSNKLIINAYPDRMDEIVKLIEDLDTKPQAVSIDARILQLTLNPRYDYGIDWQKTFSKGESGSKELWRSFDAHSSFPIDSTVSSATTLGSVGLFELGNLTEDEFNIEIRALKQVQNTKVLANPRLMILNRQEARINIGDKIPYVITTTTGTGNNVSISEEIKFIDVGLLLVVRPVINEDGYVTMNIRPEISSQTGLLTTPAGATVPQVNTTFIETSVIVKDGVTVILGGLRRDDMSENTRGVAGLMDLPLIGGLFKSRDESIQKTEIVIFLTPKIVTGDVNYTDEPIDIRRPDPGFGNAVLNKISTPQPPVEGKPLEIKRTRLSGQGAA